MTALPNPTRAELVEGSGHRTATNCAADVVSAVRTHCVYRRGVVMCGRCFAGRRCFEDAGDIKLRQLPVVIETPPHQAFSTRFAIDERPPARSVDDRATGPPNCHDAHLLLTQAGDKPVRDGAVEPGVQQARSSPGPRLLDKEQS